MTAASPLLQVVCFALTVYWLILIVRIILSWIPSVPEPIPRSETELDGGIGEAIDRREWLRRRAGGRRVTMGAKGTDLGWEVETPRGPVFVSIAEFRLLLLMDVASSDRFYQVGFQPLVNHQSLRSYQALFDQICFDDRVNPSRGRPRTSVPCGLPVLADNLGSGRIRRGSAAAGSLPGAAGCRPGVPDSTRPAAWPCGTRACRRHAGPGRRSRRRRPRRGRRCGCPRPCAPAWLVAFGLNPLSIRERKTMSSGTSFSLRMSFIISIYRPDLLSQSENLSFILVLKSPRFFSTALEARPLEPYGIKGGALLSPPPFWSGASGALCARITGALPSADL